MPDKKLCEKIFKQGGVDLRDMTEEEVKERLKEEQEEMSRKLEEIKRILDTQEQHVSIDGVWGEAVVERPVAPIKPDNQENPKKPTKPNKKETPVVLEKPEDNGMIDAPVTPKPTEPNSNQNPAPPASPVIYTVAFDANGGENVPAEQTVPAGAFLGEPTTVPTRTGYLFTGWYTDSSCTAQYDFSTPVRGSFTLYAGWKIDDTISYQVIFNANGASNPAPQTLKGGSKVSRPSLSPWSGHVFQGWYTDAECTQVYDFNTPVVSNFTLYAGWKIDNNTYTVTFDPCGAAYGGETTRTRNAGLNLGYLPVGPAVPAGGTLSATKGYTFNGWYTTKQDGGERVTENTIVTGDMTVYARWIEWGYDDVGKTLTIAIEGDMPDYSRSSSSSFYTYAPWFSQRDAVGTIVLEEGITSIGNWAFAGFSKLSNITLPQSVTRIGVDAFYGCSSLQSIVIPEGITVINGGTFTGCSSLTNVTLPQSLRSINNANYYWTGPNLGGNRNYDGAFEGCTSLTEIEIPGNVTYIGTQAFQGCSKLTSIVIPEGVTSIQHSTFTGCTALAEITLPKSLRTIQGVSDSYSSGAFAGCTSLTEIVIPENVTSIGAYAFSYCSKLKSIEISDNVTAIAGATFYRCSSLTSVRLPKNLKKIETIQSGDWMSGYSYYGAFDGCLGLTEITLPVSVTSIAGRAFDGCNNLKNVYVDGTAAEKKWSYNFGSNVTIHYKDAEPAAVSTSLEDEEAVSGNEVQEPSASGNDVSSGDVLSDDVEEQPTVSGDGAVIPPAGGDGTFNNVRYDFCENTEVLSGTFNNA